MKYVVMGMALVVVASASASAQQAAAPAQGGTADQAAVQKKADGKKKVCRRVEVTGSIMRETICRSVDQWTAEDKASQADAERLQGSRRSGAASQ